MTAHVLPLLDKHGLAYKIHKTASPNDAASIARTIASEPSPHKVIVAGGDGTSHELMEGITSGRWELVILPLGTANALYYSFHPNDESKLASLNLALEGKSPIRLPVTYTTIGDQNVPSTIVTSTALHAAILKDSEELRSQYGIERYAMAAAKNLGVFFNAKVRLSDGKKWNHKTKKFEASEQELKGPFTYLVSCTTVDRLEPTFVIAPTRRLEKESLDGTMDVVIMRPLRDPKVRDADDKAAAWAERAKEVLGAAYEEGRHVELEYEAGESVVEVFRCTGFEWVPLDGGSSTVCCDGSLYEIPEGGSAKAQVKVSGEDGIWAWL